MDTPQQAMAVGCPVICTEGGSISQLIKEFGGGYVVQEKNSAELEQAILNVSKKQNVDKQYFDISETITKQFSWKAVLDPLVEYCRDPYLTHKSSNIQLSVSKQPSINKQALFSVVIPTYNRMDIFPDVIAALEGQKKAPPFEIIIVNDGSTDDTSHWLAQYTFKIKTKIIETRNQGPAIARNTGIGEATGDYIVLLGDDMVPEPFWLYYHALGHQQSDYQTHTIIIGHTDWHPDVSRSRFLNFLDRTGWQFGFDQIEDPDNVPFNFFYGSNLSASRQLLQADGFDVDFPYPAWEDIELGYRLCNAGAVIKYIASARTAHMHATTINRFSQRHWRTGYSAVRFYQLHPDLEYLLWPSAENISTADSGLKKYGRLILAKLLERFPINLPTIWEHILRDYYIDGIRVALQDLSHDQQKTNSISRLSLLPIKWAAKSPLLHHATGSLVDQTWQCMPIRDMAGHCVYGPYFPIDQQSRLSVTMDLSWATNKAEPKIIATIDVYDSVEDEILNDILVFSNHSPSIELKFESKPGQKLEFRIYWHGDVVFEFKSVTLNKT